MNTKGVRMDRWMMHRKNVPEQANATGKKFTVSSQYYLFHACRNVDPTRDHVKRGRARGGDADEMLYDDAFEDDEEYGGDIGEDQNDQDEDVRSLLRKTTGIDFLRSGPNSVYWEIKIVMKKQLLTPRNRPTRERVNYSKRWNWTFADLRRMTIRMRRRFVYFIECYNF
jgi:hypothetical protein